MGWLHNVSADDFSSCCDGSSAYLFCQLGPRSTCLRFRVCTLGQTKSQWCSCIMWAVLILHINSSCDINSAYMLHGRKLSTFQNVLSVNTNFFYWRQLQDEANYTPNSDAYSRFLKLYCWHADLLTLTHPSYWPMIQFRVDTMVMFLTITKW